MNTKLQSEEMDGMPTAQGTAGWHEWRKKGIGATDASAICGYSEWGSPMSVFVQKTQNLPKEPKSGVQEWGNRIEPLLIDKIAEEFKDTIAQIERGGLYIHPKIEWAKASLDGGVQMKDGSLFIIECKTGRSAIKWNPVPDGYYAQAQWQMFVTGAKQVIFSVLIQGSDWFYTVCDYDEAYAEAMYAKCRDFWENNVLKGIPPEVSKGETDVNALKKLIDLSTDERMNVEVSSEELIQRYQQCKAMLDTAELDFANAKACIMKEMIDGKNLTWQGMPVAKMVSRSGTEVVDKKLLQSLAPDVYAKVVRRANPASYVKFYI